jgi:hypothetical protein
MKILTDEQLALIEKAQALRLDWPEYAQWAFYEEFIDPPNDYGVRTNGFAERMWILAVRLKFRCPDWSARRAWTRVCRIGAQIDAEGRWGFVADADDEACFEEAWTKSRPTLGDPLIDALAWAERYPITWPNLHRSAHDAYGKFKTFVAFLAVIVDRAVVALPVVRIGAVLRHRPLTICVWRSWGEQEGWLIPVVDKNGQRYSKNEHRATRYRVAPEAVQVALVASGKPLTKSTRAKSLTRKLGKEERRKRSPTTASADGSDAVTDQSNSALENERKASPVEAQPTSSASEAAQHDMPPEAQNSATEKSPRRRASEESTDAADDDDSDEALEAWMKRIGL